MAHIPTVTATWRKTGDGAMYEVRHLNLHLRPPFRRGTQPRQTPPGVIGNLSRGDVKA